MRIPRMRPSFRTRPSTRRALMLAGGAGLAVAVLMLAGQRGPAVRGTVLISAVPVPGGTVLDDATLAGFTSARISGDGRLTGLVGDPAAVAGRRLAHDLGAGEPLTLAAMGGGDVVPAPLLPGERAVPVPARASAALSQALRPGVRVDVVASTGEGLTGRTRVVVADAEVLAVDPAAAPGDPAAADGGTVLLRAGSRDALLITAALNFARDVRLLARPADEPPGPSGQEVAVP